MKKLVVLSLILFLTFGFLQAQEPVKDTGIFIEPKSEYWDTIKAGIEKFEKKDKEPRRVFKMDFSNKELPTSTEQFKQVWHNEPVSQGNTGTCWSFSTTSFFESEIYRLYGKKIKLSPIYTAYWEYVEKVRRFVKERGNSLVDEGSEANAVMKIWKKYGIVPLEAYSGMLPGQVFHNHSHMIKEIRQYLNSVKEDNAWDEERVIGTVKAIMNHYLGTPPTSVKVGRKSMSPQEYFKKVVKLNPDDYVEFLSLKQHPYWEMVEYKVPDNWWHSEDYLNIPLDDFISVMKSAVRNGFSVCLGGDVSEAGYESHAEVAMVPTFDIPAEYIDENSRQFRFSNHTTTDDHGIHCVGYMEGKDGKDWYLIKDSGSGSKNGKNRGYYFYHEDYVKLKMMNILVHKDAAKDILKKYEQHLKSK